MSLFTNKKTRAKEIHFWRQTFLLCTEKFQFLSNNKGHEKGSIKFYIRFTKKHQIKKKTFRSVSGNFKHLLNFIQFFSSFIFAINERVKRFCGNNDKGPFKVEFLHFQESLSSSRQKLSNNKRIKNKKMKPMNETVNMEIFHLWFLND